MESKIYTKDSILNINNVYFAVTYLNDVTQPGSLSLIGPHVHSCYEIYVNISGDVSFLVNNRIYNISHGDIIMTKSGDVHHCICNKTCVHEHFCIWIDEAEPSELTQFLRNSKSPYLNIKSPDMKDHLICLLRKIYSLYECGSGLSKTAVLLSILDLIATESTLALNQEDNIPVQLQQILDYMNAKFTSLRHISELTDKFFISTATLNRWFKRYINLTPHEFLEAKRLGYAEQLLRKGYSVTEASEISGFADCSHFICVFKKHFSVTPHKYRRTL